jgi:type III restriction enzyme
MTAGRSAVYWMLIRKCAAALDEQLRGAPPQYRVQRGKQLTDATYEGMQAGDAFELHETQPASLTSPAHSAVTFDLSGKLADQTQLPRCTIGWILG